MSDVLKMSACQFRNPVIFFIAVVSGNRLLHGCFRPIFGPWVLSQLAKAFSGLIGERFRGFPANTSSPNRPLVNGVTP